MTSSRALSFHGARLSTPRVQRSFEAADLRGVRPVGDDGDSGGHDEIEALYRSRRADMVRLAYLLTGSLAVAEELVQEAFLRVWPRMDEVDNLSAYLRTTVVNLARRHHRRRGVERRHAPQPPGPVLDPETDETWQLLWRLPERQRAALALRFYEDLDVAGVANAMGCRLGTAKSLIHRGVQAMRRELGIDE